MPMILGYWDIRGLGHAIRLLLEYTDSVYEEKTYRMGDGNGILVCSDFCPTHANFMLSIPCPGCCCLALRHSTSWIRGLPLPKPFKGAAGLQGRT